MTKLELDKRKVIHRTGIRKRFPQLPDDIIEYSWSGVVSRTRNSSQIFEKLNENIFVAGCYNGAGIGVGTLFGEQIAIKASNAKSEEIEIIESLSKPKILPSNPLLDLGIQLRLFYERLKANSEL
jgi:glycine/D-amino acid oxidase-like deaminating enzyme